MMHLNFFLILQNIFFRLELDYRHFFNQTLYVV